MSDREKLESWLAGGLVLSSNESDAAIRGVLEENERLRAWVTTGVEENERLLAEVKQERNHWVRRKYPEVAEEMLDQQARIDAALTIAAEALEGENERLIEEENKQLIEEDIANLYSALKGFAFASEGDVHPKVTAAIRGVLEEIERLRDPCAAAGRHVCGPGDAEARIDAALAVVMGTRAVGNPHLESVLTKIVEALKGKP